MPSTDGHGAPFRSKIAAIQEHSNFPQVEHGLGAEDLDLQVRPGFARHTLVGLNIFLIEMAAQFPDVLGIRTQDPMMGDSGLAPLTLTRDAIVDQAAHRSATIAVSGIRDEAGSLKATVTLTNKTGHKLPSGVGFRRAFVEFKVLDAEGAVLWASGGTDGAGTIVDEAGRPIAGELWWGPQCAGKVSGADFHYQPHYRVISRQDQAQIYQELVTAPPKSGPVACGHDASPSGDPTTSFLSICVPLKDNRLLPQGFLKLDDRVAIARALGAADDMATDVAPVGVAYDPDYETGGGDSLVYRIPLRDIRGQPAAVEASLYYQATPPYFLQDRFCTAQGTDADRLAWLANRLDLKGTRADKWKLLLVSTGRVPIR